MTTGRPSHRFRVDNSLIARSNRLEIWRHSIFTCATIGNVCRQVLYPYYTYRGVCLTTTGFSNKNTHTHRCKFDLQLLIAKPMNETRICLFLLYVFPSSFRFSQLIRASSRPARFLVSLDQRNTQLKYLPTHFNKIVMLLCCDPDKNKT